jgi:hypothetical protein
MKRLFGGAMLVSSVVLAGCGVFVPNTSSAGDSCPNGGVTFSHGCTLDDDCAVGDYCHLDTLSCCSKNSCSSSDECPAGLWCVVDAELGSACKSTRDCSQVVDDAEGFCRDELGAPADAEVMCDIEKSPPECAFATP